MLPSKAAGKTEDGSEHAQVSLSSFVSGLGDLSGETSHVVGTVGPGLAWRLC